MDSPLPPLRAIHEDSGEYAAFLAELQHAVDLLTEGGVSAERMALAITDSLAERLLFRHAQRCFSVGDTGVGILIDPFPADRRARILGDFRRRVQLALTDEEFFIFISPLLDEADADVFRLAHDYRGPSYHRGHYNPALAGPLGRLYVCAVGRAFTRAMGDALGGFPPNSVPELERYRGSDVGQFSPRHETAPIVESITASMTVERRELAKQLRLDIENRLAALETAIDGLRKDLDEKTIGELIEAAQHWAENRGDEQLHGLARERQALENEADDRDQLGDELAREIVENQLAQFARMQELKARTEIRVDLDTIGSIGRRLRGFAAKQTVPNLLHAYRQVDDLLEVLENAVEWVQYSWERSVEEAVEEARGK